MPEEIHPSTEQPEDPPGGPPAPPVLANRLEQALTVVLFAMAACAPFSISVTQGCWVLGLLLWFARSLVRPRPRFRLNRVSVLLLVFVGLTFLSAVFSYDTAESFSKLRSVSLFSVAFLVAASVPSRRTVRLLGLTLLGAGLVTVLFTLGGRMWGRGIKVAGLRAESPLRMAGVEDGDTVLAVDGVSLRSPEQLARALESYRGCPGPARLKLYRFELVLELEAPRNALLPGGTAAEQLGVGDWSRGRDWRAAGFYGHYATYAEVLQLLGSLVVGLFLTLPEKRSWRGAGMVVAGFCFTAALALTLTRGASVAFLVSAFVIVLASANRRALLILAVIAALVVPAGLLILKQKRNISFFDSRDSSTMWRQTVYREGTALSLSKPRHWLVGIGMDSLKTQWARWGMFDHGRLPRSHLHSTPLQIALERGIPALLTWLALLGSYGWLLITLARRPGLDDWIERGLVLGALGGLTGFFLSGFVHYNMGDSEVITVFYFLMGLMLFLDRTVPAAPPAGTVST